MSDSPRLEGEDGEHIRALVELDVQLPPITVHRTTMRVIDGMHRLRAAVLRRQDFIDAYLVDAEPDDVFVLAVEANIQHGLPLTFADRKAAAARIVRSHPHWSDRAIAAKTGLSPKT
ncbi:ParB N-terminal domain-containing protein, partial [Kibdelosporangium lantanae]